MPKNPYCQIGEFCGTVPLVPNDGLMGAVVVLAIGQKLSPQNYTDLQITRLWSANSGALFFAAYALGKITQRINAQ